VNTHRPLRRLLPFLVAASASTWTARAQTVTMPTEVVTAARTAQPAEQVAVTVRSFDAEALRAAPTATLDGALRAVPGFSLFRRSDSFTANPTAQGVSLRGLGPSGASRSLVLLDGVPLNDPFGGWVAWTKVPRENLARIEVVPGGGASAWGNAALGGVVQILTQRPSTQTTAANVTLGDFGTRSTEIAHTQPGALGTFDIEARAFATDGFALIAPERRGPIDIAARSRHTLWNLRWRQSLGEQLAWSAAFRSYEEQRGNGTPYQRNGTRERALTTEFAGQASAAFGWKATAYAQDQRFSSTFSGVNATRTAETPASDQFSVPAKALGAAWTGTWKHASGARTSAGADARTARGETREYFTLVAGNFTRLRVAGGKQADLGIFALHERALAPELRGTVGVRLNSWDETDGHRRESDRATGVASRDDHYPDHDGTVFSPSAGLVWTPATAWRVRANAQHGFRRPTLNELYRPFRQGANVTEANAALRTEKVTTAEVGAEWVALVRPTFVIPQTTLPDGTIRLQSIPLQAPQPLLTLAATAFWNDLRDAVGNVTIARGPGTYPIVGFVAAGGLGRQRLNLDRTRTQGIELLATWNVAKAFSLNAAALFNDATVRRATVAPALVGKQVAQVPRRSATLGATWRAPGQFTFTPRVRWIGRQFEDDENLLTLGEVVVADLGVTRPVTKHLTLFLTLENLTDARVETGRSADGVVNVGTPRLFLGGVRGAW
jgi:outer membrane receptor protein involved in Fe transport